MSEDSCYLCSLGWGVGIVIALYLIRRWIKGGQFTERVSAKGKVVVITGANTGIGIETVRELNLRGAKVYMLCRNEERAQKAIVNLVKMGCDSGRLIFLKCDLTSFRNVRETAKFLEEAEEHIDILINNAGIMYHPKHELTEDGHEMTWQSNYLGHFLLTELLLPLVKKSEEGRIIDVSSKFHMLSYPLDLETIDNKESFKFMVPYIRSKLANVMHSRELTRRLRSSGNTIVTINSLHPGSAKSEISRDLIIGKPPVSWILNLFLKTERDGAQTTNYLALSREVKGVSGCYFADCARATENKLALDDLACKHLYDYSLRIVGLA